MVCCVPAYACIVILVGCSNLALSGDAELTLLRKSTNFALTAHVYCRMLRFHSCTRARVTCGVVCIDLRDV